MSKIHNATVKILKDGRVTIPSNIREVEGIEKGDYVKITIEKIKSNKNKKRTTNSNIKTLIK